MSDAIETTGAGASRAGVVTYRRRRTAEGRPGRKAREQSRLVHSSILLCAAANHPMSQTLGWSGFARFRMLDGETDAAFPRGNLEQIKDAPPNSWATVHAEDFVTFSELVRRGFHLIDMRGEIWTVRRAT